ncbi:hypothetical protein Bca4012_043511 [Brassica carinata]|uniref:BnaC09g22360D protein n=4 Tax=Brassica TaxID=3705 RepID=A0A078I5J5_BRANA|nr:uncharacterized protein At4g04980 [Brassica napus]KAG2276273.1 hypothetical protein Bca52824_058828 [Brassica carinata]KAH0858451.1 hypothetical protein HID58_086712 [Brassica napus]CAF1740723.1 unnamed protein product [Brassica napus]CDY44744.1 BnaC09g22360D [Brassica napus]
MSSGRLCGFKPITFCRKLTRLQVARGLALKKLIKGKHDFRRASTSKNNVEKKKSKKIKSTASQTPSVAEASPKSFKSPKQATASGSAVSPLSVQKKPNTPRHNDFEGSSPKCTANFILMVELRKNIFSFRDMIDLPSLDGSLSVTEIITHTMKDLQKLSPEIVTINQSFDMEGAEMDKMLIFFYEDLRAIGDSWIMDSDWIYRSKYRNSGVGKNKSDRLVEHVLAALDGLIKMTKERFGMMDLDSDGRKSFKGVPSEARRSFRRSVSYSESNNSFFPSPLTPRSVIPGTMMSSSSSTSPSLWNLRAQALDKLSPVDLKQLAMRILSRRDSDSLQDLDLKNIIEEEQEESEKLGEDDEDNDSSVSETEDHSKSSETEHETEGEHHIESSGTEHVVTDGEHHKEGSETEHEDHSEPTTSETDSTESFQEAISVTKLAPPSPPPPPPSPSPSFLNKKATPLSQPPPSSPQPGRKTLSPPPPPPPSRRHDSGGNSPTTPAPPAPPGSGRTLRGKRTTSKLRRSAQIANLYWVLKGKLEGRGVEGKPSKASKGQNNVPDKSPVKGARSGMADALAEMTKRSSYFQQIEEDVQKYAKSIEELKSSIQKFQTKDMKELLEFHSKVESVLEKLTDETQVLARFEGFPEKKLEAIRTAGAVYKKLDGILVELKNWKIEPPLNDLLDKIERYFNKFKGEIETVERTKDEEAKMFQRHNINIDFEVLVQVKETMVDVSSNCMELALKERREANENAKNSEESKMNNVKEERAKRLWRAFQFAFKVYTFAGGHDERADHLTRQLAHEIQTDPDQADSSNMS